MIFFGEYLNFGVDYSVTLTENRLGNMMDIYIYIYIYVYIYIYIYYLCLKLNK